MITLSEKHSRNKLAAKALSVAFGMLFVFFGFLDVQPVMAQSPEYEQLEAYIERNAELLEWSQDIVRETENVSARKVLEEALSLHRRSIRMMEDGRPQLSYKTARSSRTAKGFLPANKT